MTRTRDACVGSNEAKQRGAIDAKTSEAVAEKRRFVLGRNEVLYTVKIDMNFLL